MTITRAIYRLTLRSLLITAVLTAVVFTAHGQTAISPRLAAFENTTLSGQNTPFAIEEMQVGDIRHIVDYLLLHGRYNLESGNAPAASAQLQWAASLMDLNAGLTDTPEQEAVRAAARGISEVAESAKSSSTETLQRATLKRFFRAHHTLAPYHQSRALKLLSVTTPNPENNAKLVRKNAIFQENAGRAMSAALTHYDRAKVIRAELDAQPIDSDHFDDLKKAYGIVHGLKVVSGQVDPMKAKSAAEKLGEAISALDSE